MVGRLNDGYWMAMVIEWAVLIEHSPGWFDLLIFFEVLLQHSALAHLAEVWLEQRVASTCIRVQHLLCQHHAPVVYLIICICIWSFVFVFDHLYLIICICIWSFVFVFVFDHLYLYLIICICIWSFVSVFLSFVSVFLSSWIMIPFFTHKYFCHIFDKSGKCKFVHILEVKILKHWLKTKRGKICTHLGSENPKNKKRGKICANITCTPSQISLQLQQRFRMISF